MSKGYSNSDAANMAESYRISDLLAIQKSLRVVNDNESSECEDCGEGIPLQRRIAIPGAKFCVACQSKAEGRRPKVVCRNVYVP
jgi:phage/conjugal plasmid C-4 type zinc finger TraR family protein